MSIPNFSTQIYQITTHKIQIFDKSNHAVKQQLIPYLPSGEIDDNENAKARKMEDLLVAFGMTKKREWTPNKLEISVLESYVVYLNK